MAKFKSNFILYRGIYLILSVVLISFFNLGSCNDNNNGNGGDDPGADPPTAMSCQPISTPCSTTTSEMNGTYFTCILSDTTCAVDLNTVLSQISSQFSAVTDTDTLWDRSLGR